MVFWENQEEQLQPFHEFECTGENDKYVVEVEQDIEELRQTHERHLKDYPESTSKDFVDFIESRDGQKPALEKDINTEEEHKYGYTLIDENRNVLKVIRRTNPNAQWDWYKLGWRWSWFFELKEWAEGKNWTKPLIMWWGEWGCDSAKKGDIDFDAMKGKAKIEAEKRYEKFISDLDGEPIPPLWSEFREKFDSIDEAREAYSKIKWVENLNRYWGLDDYLVWKEQYIKNSISNNISTFAVIKDGKWYEKWDMGWFGIVSDKKEQSDWNGEFDKLLDSIDDDTLISVYDCHI